MVLARPFQGSREEGREARLCRAGHDGRPCVFCARLGLSAAFRAFPLSPLAAGIRLLAAIARAHGFSEIAPGPAHAHGAHGRSADGPLISRRPGPLTPAQPRLQAAAARRGGSALLGEPTSPLFSTGGQAAPGACGQRKRGVPLGRACRQRRRAAALTWFA